MVICLNVSPFFKFFNESWMVRYFTAIEWPEFLSLTIDFLPKVSKSYDQFADLSNS